MWYSAVMYIRPPFRPSDDDHALTLMREFPLATLVFGTEGAGEKTGTDSGGLLQSAHVPLVFASTESGGAGVLLGHVASANPLTNVIRGGARGVAIFQGPQCYVSPQWYPDQKRNVPTWNYAVVHAHGVIHALEGVAQTEAVLSRMIEVFEDAEGWKLSQLDPGLREELVRYILAFEFRIERIEASFKLSQNRTTEERSAVLRALEGSSDPQARLTAEWMKRVTQV